MKTSEKFWQKILICSSISILFCLAARAQEGQKSAILITAVPEPVRQIEKFHWGFKLNPTFGYFHIDGPQNMNSDGLKLGFSFGLTGDWLFAKNMSLSSQLNVTTINGGTNLQNFVQAAAPAPSTGTVSTEQDTRTIYAVRYLELPLAIKFKTKTIGDGSNFYFKAGLDPALKLSAKGTQNLVTGGVVNILGSVNLGDQLGAYRLGWLAGTGYDYRFNRDLTFTSGLVYNQGFNNISKSPAYQLKNSYLAIEFGVYF